MASQKNTPLNIPPQHQHNTIEKTGNLVHENALMVTDALITMHLLLVRGSTTAEFV